MKINHPVTNKEKRFENNAVLVSETNSKGVVTQANQSFMEISGFLKDELLGKSHNIVRHPDMPPEAFADLWQTLKKGKPWMGIVKNRCKNGDHYWVDAYVAPLYQNGAVQGYQSVRVKPSQARVERAEKIYSEFRSGKNPVRRSLSALSFGAKLWLGLSLLFIVLTGAESVITETFSLAKASGGLVFLGLSAWFVQYMVSPLKKLAATTSSLADNKLMQLVYTGRRDELGTIEAAMAMYEGTLQTVVSRVEQYDKTLVSSCDLTRQNTGRTERIISEQRDNITQIASAVTELKSSIDEIARNASSAAESSKAAEQQADKSYVELEKNVNSIRSLAETVNNAVTVIRELHTASNDIGKVLVVIRDIAEQTNLLALNAAIEAARAGEQGRGFAVVADEVRTLASRTQQSTLEIQTMIERLQGAAEQATSTMLEGEEHSHQAVEQTKMTSESLQSIISIVKSINDINLQIACATEEQSSVAGEVDHNINQIKINSDEASDQAEHLVLLNKDLMDLSSRLAELVSHTRIKAVR